MAVSRLQSLTFRDAKGHTAVFRFRVTGATPAALETSAAAVVTALTPLTNAHLQSANGPYSQDPTEAIYGTNASYASIEDKAVFTFQTGAGAFHRFQVPAPIAAIFLADGETVDHSNTSVTAFTSAMVANAVDNNGNLIAFGATGIRVRRKLRRRTNIFTLDPSLTGPDE